MTALAGTLMASVGLVHAQQSTQSADAPLLTRELAAKGINPPKMLNNVDAKFSEEARAKKISGRCLASLIVDAQGNPQNIKIFRCTDSSFEKSSLDAAAKYKFKPATTQDGTPLPVTIRIEIEYHWNGGNPVTPILYGFSSPPGTLSAEPDANGVYQFTKLFTPPTLTEFSDEGYGPIAFSAKDNGTCDIVVTISAKGKPSDPQVTHCAWQSLEKPAVKSLLKSNYKPGKVNGKAAPMRVSIHLEYDIQPGKP
jgi:TonB family protein